jgi:hypothetical protein
MAREFLKALRALQVGHDHDRLDTDTGLGRAALSANLSPRPPGTGILTPLGEQLCQQARGYLQLAEPGPGTPAPSPSIQRITAS